MAWDGSTRKARLPKDWAQRRAVVLARDGYSCRWVDGLGRRCAARATDVDHVQAGDDHSVENLQALCGDHHRRKSGREGGVARARKYDRRRPKPPHPGLRSAHG